MIGRKHQYNLLRDIEKSEKSAFVAVTGRRRVGKTYLIDETYKNNLCLRVTGIQDADTQTQINNFTQQIAEYSGIQVVAPLSNWQEVMQLLKAYLKKLSKKKKQVIFIDELPWIATKRSGFIQLLAHLWNDYLSKEKHFILVICGSATSWIAKKIINDKGGFHNRITHRIELRPFTLSETKEFLNSKGISLTNQAISEIYMIMGGIPYYLEKIRKGESVSQITQRLFFSENGELKNEYDNLYKALFDHAENHEAIVQVLAKSKTGLSRKEVISQSKVSEGGPYTRAMEDLIVSGFVEAVLPYGKKKRGAKYRLLDEYSVFYHKFISSNKNKGDEFWQSVYGSQPYKIWTGYAFETLCHRHIKEIKKALGITGVYTEHYGYFQSGADGFQIDLVIDRKDNVVNLCECKYYNTEFKIDKKYAAQLRQRKQAFIDTTKTKKTAFNTLITTYGLLQNEYSLSVVDYELTIDDLM